MSYGFKYKALHLYYKIKAFSIAILFCGGVNSVDYGLKHTKSITPYQCVLNGRDR